MTNIRLKQDEYNTGALAGKYALRDMSNTGKFSNIIETNPVKTVFDINNEGGGSITLKAGSTLVVPFGLSAVDGKTPVIHYERLSTDKTIVIGHTINDMTVESQTDEKVYLVYNYTEKTLECNANIEYEFVDEDVYEDEEIISEANTFVRSSTKDKCALPLGYFDDVWHFHQFTGLGFYKDRMWADAGLRYYVPFGRKEDYSLRVNEVAINSVVYSTLAEVATVRGISTTNSKGTLLLDLYGKGVMSVGYKSNVEPTGYNDFEYASSTNYIYTDNGVSTVRLCKVCDVVVKNNKFHELKNFNVYHTVDFSEILSRLGGFDEIIIHNDGRANEDVITGLTFKADTNFEAPVTAANLTAVEGTLGGVTFSEDKMTIAEEGAISAVDADIKNVVRKASTPNSIAVVGKTNTDKGGIVFGAGNTVRVLGDETTKTLTVDFVDNNGNIANGAILPSMTLTHDIGSANQQFRNIYANYLYGTAQKSNWADLAEIYATDKEYPVGTLLQFGGPKELTIAHSEVNAVISEKPGVLMNANGEGQPVALAGRVKVRVKGAINKFDKIYLSQTDGIGTNVGYIDERPIGRALEDKAEDEEGLVLCAVHFSV